MIKSDRIRYWIEQGLSNAEIARRTGAHTGMVRAVRNTRMRTVSQAAKERWANPENRARHSQTLRKVFARKREEASL